MSEETATLRFPRRIHGRAKIEAARREMSLQDFVEGAVEDALRGDGPKVRMDPMSARVAALPERARRIVDSFVTVVELAPAFYLRAIEKYVAGMLALFKTIDKKYFGTKS